MIDLDKTLRNRFGFESFREGQKEIISSVIAKQDTLAILPTGRGKTLCYHLPALILGGLTVVVSPLVSLMEDQVTQMKASGFKKTAHLSSLLNQNEKKEILHALQDLQVLFLSPEMASLEFVQRALSRQKIALFVVDEAHCISQWGHEFRTDYLRLSNLREELGSPPCLALTATATPVVEKDIRKQLRMENENVFRYPVNRENIYLVVEEVNSLLEKYERLTSYLKQVQKPVIVYTGTRVETERVSGMLQKDTDLMTSFYHGGLTKEDRLLIQQQFLNDELDIICCTNAFGMGINKSNVRTVVHFHLPSSIEQYVQEIGRAGRDQRQSTAILLYQEEDQLLPLSFINNEFPNDRLLKEIFYENKAENLSVEEFREVFQLDDIKFRMLYYYLDKEKLICQRKLKIDENHEEVYKRLRDKFKIRKEDKLSQLKKVKNFVSSKNCFRQYISAYFNEGLPDKPSYCCSLCHSHHSYLNEMASLEGSVSNGVVPSVKNDWRMELKDMLIRHTGGKDGT